MVWSHLATGGCMEAFMKQLSNAEIIERWEHVKKVVAKLFKAFKDWVEEKLRIVITTYKKAIEIVKSNENQKKKALYKLDFKRPKIKHQVLNRKPKHLIKKVIY